MMTIVAEEDMQLETLALEVPLDPASALALRRCRRSVTAAQRHAPGLENLPHLSGRHDIMVVRRASFTCRLPQPEPSGLHVREMLALGLLALGSVFSVSYGLLCGVGFVSHWDLFQTGIQRLLQ